jgi:hypothetical protein
MAKTYIGEKIVSLKSGADLHIHVYWGTTHNSQVMEAAKMPQHWRMD